jgi:DNA-binding NarL/FixJ family response regulator
MVLDMFERSLRILIADDHPLVRAGILSTLHPHPEFRVVGQARDGYEAVRMLQQQSCDLLLLDLKMEGPGVASLIETCRALQPELKIIILSSHVEERYLGPLRELGIEGFVEKAEAPDCLLQALRVVAKGEVWFSHIVMQKTLAISEEERFNSYLQPLTRREEEVLAKIREAKDNQTIADELRLSKQTVRRYATLIYQKLGVKNRVEAIVCPGS